MKGDRELEHLLDGLRHHTTRLSVPSAGSSAGQRVAALELLIPRVRRLVRVASSVSAAADGFPGSTPGNGSPGGGKGGGRLMSVEGDLVPTSSTEAAALSAGAGDPVARLGVELLRALAQAVSGLDHVAAVLDRFDQLQNTAQVPEPSMCWVAQVKHGLQWDLEWEPYRTTDFATRLVQPFDEPRRVSKFVYWFVYNHRRLPERAEMLAQLERAVVKVRS